MPLLDRVEDPDRRADSSCRCKRKGANQLNRETTAGGLAGAGLALMIAFGLRPTQAHNAIPPLPAVGQAVAPADPSTDLVAHSRDPIAPPDWVAEGYCQPAPVAGDTLVHAFAPYATGDLEGASPIVVEASPERLRLGDYVVTFDSSAKRIAVSGPVGADILERDILRCIGPEGLTPASSVGTWVWSASDGGWRYEDSSLAEMRAQLGISAESSTP